MGSNDRAYDVVLLGATGFVGRYTASHLARSAPAGVRIALAARSGNRLQKLQRELGVANLSDPDPPAAWHWFFGTHPTTAQRVAFATDWTRANGR